MIISFAGHDVHLLPEKAIWIEALGLLCVADLHFEKDSFFNQHATFLPPYGSLETFEKLRGLIDRLKPRIVIAAGDSFHDRKALTRMRMTLIKNLNETISSVERWHWLSGNHDPAIGDAIKGMRCFDLSLAGIFFRHQTYSLQEFEVSGHYHPKIRFSLRGHIFSTPCFVQHKNRLFLPSFGQYTGGLDVNSEDFLAIVPREDRKIFIIHGNDVIAKER